MVRKLYQEYFGGELFDSQNPKNRVLMSRWQFLAVRKILRREPVSLDAILSDLPGYSSDVIPSFLEDGGSVKLNAVTPNPSALSDFLSLLKRKGYLSPVDERLVVDQDLPLRRRVAIPKLSGPRGAFLEITSACNLRCATCYNEYARSEPGRKVMSQDDMLSALKQLDDLGANHIALTGGETTLAPGWFEIGRQVKDYGMALRFYTCGVYPDDKRSDILQGLVALSPDEIRITYNGLKGLHDLVRLSKHGNGTFDDITMTVSDLLSAGQRVKLNYIICKENLGNLGGFLSFADSLSQKHGVPVPVNIGPLRSFGAADGSDLISVPSALDICLANTVVEAYRSGRGMSIATVFDCLHPSAGAKRDSQLEKISSTPLPYLSQGCGLGRTGFSIGYDGSVQVCGIMGHSLNRSLEKIFRERASLLSSAGLFHEDFSSGRFSNVLQDSIEDIWFKSPLIGFFQAFYKKEQCEPCDLYRVSCQGICPAMALRDSGDLNGKDPSCPLPFLR
ncbi:radical SAM protein [Candidatus Woesearchaeota archaeon]|nr:radical SAM protein [Candidatus Woesearchaeota archaeon]